LKARASLQTSTYIHLLEGRLRIKIPEVKRAPSNASKIEHALAQLEGITYIKANPTTGNVLILFEPEATDHSKIFRALKRLRWLKPNRKSIRQAAKIAADREAPTMTDQAVNFIARQLLQSAAEIAVERLILAWI
jgi:cation transport ATPase